VSPFKNEAYAVKLFKKQLHCQCRSTGLCYHLLAVSAFISSEKYDDTTTYKLSTLIKKKYNESRGGRKIPRKRDISIIPAPDSIDSFVKSYLSGELNESKDENLSEISDERNIEESSNESSVSENDISSDSDTEIFDIEDVRASTPVEKEITIALHKKPKHKKVPLRVDRDANISYVPRKLDNAISFCDPNDMVDIRNLPMSFEETAFPGWETVEDNNWFNDDHYNRDDIFFVESWMYALVATHQSENFIHYCDRFEAFNKDIFLVCLNTQLNDGSHWMLGVINVNTREIIILDSLNNKFRNEQFLVLRKIITMAAAAALVKIDTTHWNYIYAEDVPKQSNSYDCGLFVILYAYAIIRKEKFFSISSRVGRRWIKYIGSCFDHGIQRLQPSRLSTKSLISIRDLISENVSELNSPISITVEAIEERLLSFTEEMQNMDPLNLNTSYIKINNEIRECVVTTKMIEFAIFSESPLQIFQQLETAYNIQCDVFQFSLIGKKRLIYLNIPSMNIQLEAKGYSMYQVSKNLLFRFHREYCKRIILYH
ncbi:hypothetical protein B4U80_14082, partial [Leptotrombidium deliense]